MDIDASGAALAAGFMLSICLAGSQEIAHTSVTGARAVETKKKLRNNMMTTLLFLKLFFAYWGLNCNIFSESLIYPPVSESFTTSLQMDNSHKIKICTTLLPKDQIDSFKLHTQSHPPIAFQDIYFYSHDSVVKHFKSTTSVQVNDSYKLANSMYFLIEVCLDSIGNDKFYSLVYYVSNGSPYFKIYYNQYGNLKIVEKCPRSGCKVEYSNYDLQKAQFHAKSEHGYMCTDVSGAI